MFRETGCAAISIGRGALSNPFLFRQLAHWAEHGHPGPEPSSTSGSTRWSPTSTGSSDVGASGTRASSSARSSSGTPTSIRPRKELYHRLINLDSIQVFDETVAEIRETGPTSPIPGHFEPKVPVPSGPIDKW